MLCDFSGTSSGKYMFIYSYNSSTHAEYPLATHLDFGTGRPTAVVLKLSGYTSKIYTCHLPCSAKFEKCHK